MYHRFTKTVLPNQEIDNIIRNGRCEVNPRKSINSSSKALFLFLVWRRALPSNQTLFTRTYNGQIDRSFKVRRSLGNSLLTLITTPLTEAEITVIGFGANWTRHRRLKQSGNNRQRLKGKHHPLGRPGGGASNSKRPEVIGA